jgi:hypothetical protein
VSNGRLVAFPFRTDLHPRDPTCAQVMSAT